MIAATVAAVPRRWQVVVAKTVALAGVVVPTAMVGVLGAYGAGMGILSANGAPTVSLTDDGVLTSLLGMAGYITAIALLGLGLGILLRSVAGSIGAVVGGILILPNLAGALLPDSWDTILRFLPSSAASVVHRGGRRRQQHPQRGRRSRRPRRLGRGRARRRHGHHAPARHLSYLDRPPSLASISL